MSATANATRIELDFEKLARVPGNLRAALKCNSVATLLASWDGPIRIDARDVNLAIDAGLAYACARPSNRGH